MSIQCWYLDSKDVVRCSSCNAVLPTTLNNSQVNIRCPKCGKLMYNGLALYDAVNNWLDRTEESQDIIYDEMSEILRYILDNREYLLNLTVVLSGCLDQLRDEILGPDYYIVDPVDGTAAYEIMTKEMLRKIRRKRKIHFRRSDKK